MVKKIDSISNSSRTSTNAIENTKQIETNSISEINSINPASHSANVAPVRRATRAMTAEEREYLLRLVNEEADRLFSNNSLNERQKQTAKTAVKIAIDAAIIEEKK